jgi:hypothetical protein
VLRPGESIDLPAADVANVARLAGPGQRWPYDHVHSTDADDRGAATAELFHRRRASAESAAQ